MIYAKTEMKKMPKNCNDCYLENDCLDVCKITGCSSGKIALTYCPLIEGELVTAEQLKAIEEKIVEALYKAYNENDEDNIYPYSNRQEFVKRFAAPKAAEIMKLIKGE